MRRIGIYAGTFDPVHDGHIGFALAACKSAQLSVVYMLPERFPRYKLSVSLYADRVAQLHAIITEPIKVLELPDDAFSVTRTLPELVHRFPGTQLVVLVGSDIVSHMNTWPDIDELVKTCEFAIGMRGNDDPVHTLTALHALGIRDSQLTIIHTAYSHMSSTAVRSRG